MIRSRVEELKDIGVILIFLFGSGIVMISSLVIQELIIKKLFS